MLSRAITSCCDASAQRGIDVSRSRFALQPLSGSQPQSSSSSSPPWRPTAAQRAAARGEVSPVAMGLSPLTGGVVQLELAEPLSVLCNVQPCSLQVLRSVVPGAGQQRDPVQPHPNCILWNRVSCAESSVTVAGGGLWPKFCADLCVDSMLTPCCTHECCCAGLRARARRAMVPGHPGTRRSHRKRPAARVLCSRLHSLRWAALILPDGTLVCDWIAAAHSRTCSPLL